MKFQFDENLPPALAKSICALTESDGDTVIHVADYAKGLSDVELFHRALACEVEVHITMDCHQRRSAEREAIARLGLKVFVLASGWQTLGLYPKAALLISYWPEIRKVSTRMKPGAILSVPHRRNGILKQLSTR